MFEETLDFRELFVEVFRHAKIGRRETIKVFEHACCRSGSRDEFQNLLPFGERMVLFLIAGDSFVVEATDAVIVGSGRGIEMTLGKSLFEMVDLFLYTFGS